MFPPLPESLVRNVVYPVYRGFRNDRILDILDELEHNQFLPDEEIEDLKCRKLTVLLEAAGRYVPYYADLFEREGIDTSSFGESADISKIPFLTRDIIRSEKGRMISKDPLRKGYLSSMGGSAEEPLNFWCDMAAAPVRRATAMRGYRWTGFDIGGRQALLWGFPPDRSLKERFSEGTKNFFNNILALSSFGMTPEAMRKYAVRLRRFCPSIVTGYPSALEAFSGFCRDTGTSLPPPKAIVTGGEKLFPYQRKLIEEVFGAGVYDRYGSREFSIVAHECPEHNGLHVFSDLFHVEVIHESGRPAESGETGEIVITDLSNLYMPFIRYRTGDQVVRGGTKCPCGRGFPLLERLEGRSPDDIVAPEGKVIDHIPSPAEGKEKVVISNMEERLVIKSKIHKAHINGEEPGENDCLRIDARLMELGNISAYEKVLIVNATNGARLETFAREAPGGSGEITACGAVSKLCGPGDEISVMAFTWSRGDKGDFSNILVDERNMFVRYLTEKAGDMI
jgi:phenylacetate-CoA ligase